MYNTSVEELKILENRHIYSCLNEHMLEGLFFAEGLYEKGERAWKQQWFRNKVYQDTLAEIAPLLGENVVILKGMALLESLYEDSGKRFMSDIDLLVSIDDLDRIREILKDNEFEELNENKKWLGDNFKSEWTKTIYGVEVNIELHTRLFYHVSDLKWSTIPSKIVPLRLLCVEDMFLHLIGHCAFQHNFLKLYWLFDIYFFQKENQIDWVKLIEKAEKMKIKSSTLATIWTLNKFFATNIDSDYEPSEKIMKIITSDYLINPNQGGRDYYKLKHYLKDSFFESLRYDLFWFLQRIRNQFVR